MYEVPADLLHRPCVLILESGENVHLGLSDVGENTQSEIEQEVVLMYMALQRSSIFNSMDR